MALDRIQILLTTQSLLLMPTMKEPVWKQLLEKEKILETSISSIFSAMFSSLSKTCCDFF